jgi:hypothetical protein
MLGRGPQKLRPLTQPTWNLLKRRHAGNSWRQPFTKTNPRLSKRGFIKSDNRTNRPVDRQASGRLLLLCARDRGWQRRWCWCCSCCGSRGFAGILDGLRIERASIRGLVVDRRWLGRPTIRGLAGDAGSPGGTIRGQCSGDGRGIFRTARRTGLLCGSRRNERKNKGGCHQKALHSENSSFQVRRSGPAEGRPERFL